MVEVGIAKLNRKRCWIQSTGFRSSKCLILRKVTIGWEINYSRCTVYPAHKRNTRPELIEMYRLFWLHKDRPCSDTHTASSAWPPHRAVDCHVRQGMSTWLSTRSPLAWKQLCGTEVFPFCFTGIPCVESLRSDIVALKGHELCVCRIGATNLCHPFAAA